MPPRTSLRAGARLPLVVTGDAELLDDLLRLAAAGGTELDVAPDPAAARSRYAAAPLVFVGVDQAQACLRARLPRRPRVVLVGRSDGDDKPWHQAELLGAEHVALLPAAEPWLVDRFAERAPGSTTATAARVIGVVGGRGGAGASVLAGALAVTGTRAGLRTLLVDADPLGGGLDLVLGWEQLDGLRWPGLTETDGRVDPPALVRALPSRGDLVVLSWDRGDLLEVPVEAMAATMDAGRRGRDLVVVDLPRHLDDAAVVALQATDHVFVVVPAELRATAAAARVIAAVAPHCAELSVVVRGPAPGRLKAREVARALDLPLVGTLRPEPGLSRGMERGEAPTAGGRGPLAALCQRIVADIAGVTPRAVA
ncbi:helicase/secretion neighborhood CpaE-like protein [Micromonospora pattaloongensis]|uniref:Helicase/secretion neighborhood CpaE-like protein n=1 Tax=Micromonospora pattaloongensis TaxID=405436 RepID=A0A1H3SCN7_9ACTN|nr:septum site-determining protein Ssd [Micromonospora pattaloongensis]SDZ35664.1 helicase/secretion neighborhood CpaE-like protein [Micromonospora pattaloongensis]